MQKRKAEGVCWSPSAMEKTGFRLGLLVCRGIRKMPWPTFLESIGQSTIAPLWGLVQTNKSPGYASSLGLPSHAVGHNGFLRLRSAIR